MKIDEMNQQAAVAYLTSARAESKAEVADAHGDSASRQQQATDKVDLSSSMSIVPQKAQSDQFRASRVEEIKAQMAAGTYNISSQEVAEKMLSKLGKSQPH